MKKIVCILVLSTVIAGGVFSQEVKNWFSGEASIFGVGARYERMLNKNFSVGASTFFNSLILWNAVSISAAARYYPWAGVFYIENDLGYGWITGTETITDRYGTYSTLYATRGVMLTPGVGWRIDVGDPGGFFINPMVGLPVVFGKRIYDSGGDSSFKVGTHLRLAFALGGAF